MEFNTLTVINDQNWQKGRETYLALKQLGSTYMQFIPIVERHAQTQSVTDFSVPAEGYGKFLVDVFHEWYEHDVGKIYVSQFDNLLGQWLGYPSSTCVHQPTCGQSLVTEANGDVYTCDHFVYPEYKMGNLTQQPLTEIVLSSKQQQFGLEKSQKLTALCRHCEFRKLCYGAALNIVLFLSKMNPIHIIIYVPLTVISLNKRHSICKPWLVKFDYIHPPLKVE